MATIHPDPPPPPPSTPPPQTQTSTTPPNSSSPTTTATTTTTTPTPPRLSLPLTPRLLLLTSATFTTGFFLGGIHGLRTHSLQFRAENAHRLPRSQAGWYLYHKSKTYASLLGGVKEGFKYGARVSVWTGLFIACEEVVDRGRGRWRERVGGLFTWPYITTGSEAGEEGSSDGSARRRRRRKEDPPDALGTVVASLATAGAFCLWNKFTYATSVHTAKKALLFGVVFGISQDLLRTAKGEGTPSWIALIQKMTRNGPPKRGIEIATSSASS